MCHFATISEGELAQLRRIPHIIRKGRVQAVDAQGLNFASGTETMPVNALYIDCTASALDVLRTTEPIFSRARSCRNWYVRHW